MKLNVCLSGEGFVVAELQKYITASKLRCKILLVQEFGEIRPRGILKGQKSPYGLCWLIGISLKQFNRIAPILKTYKINSVCINVQEKDIKTQCGLLLDKGLLKAAVRADADIEIVDMVIEKVDY